MLLNWKTELLTVKLEKAALVAYLNKQNAVYYGKIFELREVIQAWLEYIPQSFPHYTRHTIQHSDEIVLQLSKLLFREDDPDQPVINLSAVEAYVLIAAAYLHDVGMVLSDTEKLEILSSPEWKGVDKEKWSRIQEICSNQRIPKWLKTF